MIPLTSLYRMAFCASACLVASAAEARPLIYVKGAILVSGCDASANTFFVKNGAQPATMTAPTRLADGRQSIGFSFVFNEEDAGTQVQVRASTTSVPCAGGAFNPASQTVTAPRSGLIINYAAPAPRTVSLSADELAGLIDGVVRSAELKLHNNGSQASYVKIAGRRVAFDLDKVVVDLDCGLACPDLGDGLFYVNDLKMTDGSFSWEGGDFLLTAGFEDADREIKGFHNTAGDNAMPDFELGGPLLKLRATPKVAANGKLTLGFYQPVFTASISSTGGCNAFDLDICDAVWDSDRLIQKGIELASTRAMNGADVQAAIQGALAQWLATKGVTTIVVTARVQGDLLVLGVR